MTFSVALCGGASLLVMAGSAMAQQAPAGAPPTGASAPQALETVVVTGSRIIRDGYAAPTPITVVTVEQLQQTTPSNIPEALNKLPQFAGSTTSTGASNTGGVPNVYGGNFLNLRSFGAIRTLILMDGRRVPPTAVNAQVDTNTLPQMLVQRVDVVTGGASAVYGSDAVTGVVNFVLDKHFTGFKAQVQDGVSSHSDARSYKLGMAGGTPVFDRGHFIWSAERYQNDGMTSHTVRGWAAANPVYVGSGTAANPFVLINNSHISNASLGGLATSGPFSGQQFLSNGSLGPFDKGAATQTNGISIGGDGAVYTGLSLSPPLQTNQGFGRFEYAFSDAVTGYVQMTASQAATLDFKNSNAPAIPTTIYSGNAFLTPAEQAQLTSAGTPSFTISRLNRDLAADSRINQLTNAMNVTAGMTGTTFRNFVWDAYYTHGEAHVRSTITNNINYPNLYAALDAVKDTSGNIVCRVSITNPGLYPGCAPINLFGAGNESAAAKAFIYTNTQWEALNKIDDFAASLSGAPFDNWAGPVSTAFNVEYRAQSFAETSNANPLIAPSVTGIRLGQAPTTIYAYATQSPQQGSNTVWEVSAETVFPLLLNAPLAKVLEVNGAVRYTDYSSSGPATTWKVGLNYQPIQDLRFRFTESRDIRAPTLNDLYSGTTVSLVNLNDPHTGKVAVTTQIGGGNRNLVPEIARTETAGLVYSPSWFPRFRVSVDYFNINIDNAIGTISGSQAATLQECENSGGASALCAAIVRPLPFSDHSAANFPTLVYNQNLNIAKTYTHGVDVESSYNIDLADISKSLPGRVDLRLLLTYQPVLASKAYADAQLVNGAGVAGVPGVPGVSSTRVSGSVDYKIGPLTFDWQTRYYSKLVLSGNPQLVYSGPGLPAIYYHDVSLTYRFKAHDHDMQVFLIVDNLLDQAPRISPSTASTTPGGGIPAVVGDDTIGRYYTAGLRFKF
ncbi:MAG: TonB-dependent receptor [Caulobacteraceae bacterium]|nr:TonB-dependent receptor [Caulobacteraceae bacterium]